MLPQLTRALVLAAITCGCGPSTIVGIEVTGSIGSDLRMDLPCDEIGLRPELDGVVLRFTGPDGSALGDAITGTLESTPLEPVSGTEAWLHHGCRFFARYSVRLPVSASYTVTFTAPPPPDPRTGTFTGVSELEPQTATYAELEARAFEWNFEAGPSYVVP